MFLLQNLSAADIFMVKLLVNHGLLRLIYEYATKEIYLVIILKHSNFYHRALIYKAKYRFYSIIE